MKTLVEKPFQLEPRKDFGCEIVDTKTFKGFTLIKCKRAGNTGSHCWWKAVQGDTELNRIGGNLANIKTLVTRFLNK